MKISRLLLMMALAGALAAVTIACSSSGDSVTASAGQGVLSVRVHDDPSDQIDQAWITFTGVNAIAVDGTRVAVSGSDLLGDPIDLAALIDGNEEELAAGTVPAGDYARVELVISAVELVLDDGTTVNLPVIGSGFALLVDATFQVVEGDETVLRVDIPLTTFQPGPGGSWQMNIGGVTAR